MANNKNQHFVPRCYLKPFTVSGENAAINVFNLNRKMAIANAPVKNQCSANDFYGQDDLLEKAIQSVESEYGGRMQNLLGPTPILARHDTAVLRLFIYLQHLRTEHASLRLAEMTFMMHDLPGVETELPSLKQAMREGVIAAMHSFSKTMRLIEDLKICLVRNRTETPFFTSDDPAILTNRWHLQNRRTQGRGFGAKSAGALFLMPLSPDIYCVAYDGDVYSIPQVQGWLNVNNTADVAALNEHQILNCARNLYFRDWEFRHALTGTAASIAPNRPERRHKIFRAVLDKQTDWGKRYTVRERDEIKIGDEVLIHVIAERPEPSRWPSFLSYRRDGKAYYNKTGAGYTRRWCLESGLVTGDGYQRIRL